MSLRFVRFCILILSIPILSTSNLFAQKLEANWKTGDTLEYFITESDLVEDVRIGLQNYSIEIHVKKHDSRGSHFIAYLHLPMDLKKGRNWSLFYERLKRVPFHFYFQQGTSFTFSNAIQIRPTMDALDQVMIDLLTQDHLSPFESNEISKWLDNLKPKDEVPQNLLALFHPLNHIFDQYGQQIPSDILIPYIDPVQNCGDSVINLKWNIEYESHKINKDTFAFSTTRSLHSTNQQNKFQALANCKLLKGLDVIVEIDDYDFVETDLWKQETQSGQLVFYSFDQIIKMQFGDVFTSRGKKTRIIRMR